MKRNSIALLMVLISLSVFSCSETRKGMGEEEVDSNWTDTVRHLYQYGICIDSLDVNAFPIRSGDNMALIFSRLGFSPAGSDSIIRACSNVLDPARLRAGMHYTTFTATDSLLAYIVFSKSKTDFAVIDLSGDSIRSYEFSKPVTLKRFYTEGTVKSSLWNELQQSGVNPLLAIKIADVYAWQIDFYDVKEGDAYRVSYDVAYIDDTTALGIESIRGAVFTHLKKDYAAIPFTQDSVFEYFDKEGNSLRKAFLKTPLDFFRITSRFSNSRLHPVLKIYRAHHGVDYAAPAGTPVKSIGAGVVAEKAYQGGGAGNYLKVKHNSVYTTTYMHLSRFAKGIQKGSTVQQGEVIGYVGSTGLATGPHLDFRVHKNGQPINPLNMESPPSLPVKPELADSFKVQTGIVMAELDSFRLAAGRNY